VRYVLIVLTALGLLVSPAIAEQGQHPRQGFVSPPGPHLALEPAVVQKAQRAHPKQEAAPVVRSVAPPSGSVDWDAIANCESHGIWDTNTGNSYYGGLQENMGFWTNYGGLAFAARPDLASKAEQIVVAERGLARQGLGAWPYCGQFG
jgi:resuscitation-promoting factor RpfB